jgi:hypothetical protein
MKRLADHDQRAAGKEANRQQEIAMASTATELRISDLPRRQASALKRKAQRMGLSAGDYVKQLIEDDLALDQMPMS